MEAGTTGALNVAATCAAAGIIVGVVTLTGLGLKFSSIILAYAGGSLALTALYTALIVWIVGLAVPVTASYIICAVIAAPALITLGVPGFRGAHVHLLLRAALGSVAAHGAVALRGRGHHRRRSVQAPRCRRGSTRCRRSSCRFFFVLDPIGAGVLLKLPAGASWLEAGWLIFLGFFAIAALAAGLQGWLFAQAAMARARCCSSRAGCS